MNNIWKTFLLGIPDSTVQVLPGYREHVDFLSYLLGSITPKLRSYNESTMDSEEKKAQARCIQIMNHYGLNYLSESTFDATTFTYSTLYKLDPLVSLFHLFSLIAVVLMHLKM
jgi:hypothetical protein